MLKRLLCHCAVGFSIAVLSGCGTLITQIEMRGGDPFYGPNDGQKIESKIFSGTMMDLKGQVGGDDDKQTQRQLFLLLDLPFSFVADIVILPYTVSCELAQ